MRYLHVAGRLLSSACCIFTVVLFIILGGAAVASDQVSVLLGKNALLFFVFSLFFAISNQFLKIPSLSIVWRISLHLVCTMADFILVLFVFTGYYAEHGRFTVGAAIAYMVVYLAIACGVLLTRRAISARKNDAVPYQSQFQDQKKK